jgi:shikimate dehydrogenase
MCPDNMTTYRSHRSPEQPPTNAGTLVFLGVSTSGSSIMDLFPRWAAILGLRGEIQGRDLPLAAEPAAYREAVRWIAEDDRVAGALVTSHKVDVYRHAGSLLSEIDRYARLCREISCISKRGGRLLGHAKDPITAGRALAALLGPDHWQDRQAQVLCLGAGGAGTAITVRLLTVEPAPARIIVADRDPTRLATLQIICEELGSGRVRLARVGSAEDADALLAGLAPRSLVVNATGMGKDVPGSPLSDRVAFPPGSVVWDLNYRGDLRFLRQALAQAERRGLELHDGWGYFLHGWSEVVAEVYGLDLTPELFTRLAGAAEPLRPSTPARH